MRIPDSAYVILAGALVFSLMTYLLFIPMFQAEMPHEYTGVVTYKSPIQSYGVGIGAVNRIYLVVDNQSISCDLLNMNSQQQAHILSLQVNQSATITTIGQNVCDTK